MSPVARIDPLLPVSAPEGLSADVDDGLVRVHWSVAPERAVSEDSEETVSFGFNLFRRGDEEGAYPPTPLNPKPVSESLFEDRSVAFGQRWCYVVRKVVVARERVQTEGADTTEEVESAETAEEVPPPPPSPPHPGALIESVDSEEICLTPVDTFPPPSPTDVIAVESQGGIFLSWREVEAADLGGYLVYRALEPEGPFEQLTAEPIDLASFTDQSVEPGVTYHYTVSAVDRAEPPNESPQSQPASAQAP